MPKIDQARILIMATDGFEQSELIVPRDKLRAAGARVEVASPSGQEIRGWDETDWGETVPVDLPIDQAKIDNYDALVLPGGQINPDKLRTEPKAVDLVKQFVSSGKVVAAICHGPWLLVEADALRGRKVTSFQSIKTDVANAGGNWVDQEVVVDQGIITSRSPKDLDAFVGKIVEEVQEGRHQRAA
ncbi:type 1 glutamine amidotransferase domain-containing protein [Geminicoccus flavidas]|uniref:type 1 glutamine amidotransferase domain-containing protein n=1 Tax=Geminicoccus flavidas TaxID=2506407 RepID=UPI00135AA222|nr:type 1 glutamine amidotransferase domain-containing protein [Geminicoccus flavidas]